MSGGEQEVEEFWREATQYNTLSLMAESLVHRTKELHYRGRSLLRAKRWRFNGPTTEGYRGGRRAQQGVGVQAQQVEENGHSRRGEWLLYFG